MNISKAVITSAGFGTRLLPISKTIQKEMLPILNRPVIDYVVEDCVKAGIEDIIFVVNEHNYQVLHYYRENLRLKRYLEQVGKAELYQYVEKLHQKANFYFVKQSDQDQYGTAVPITLAKNHLQNESAFLYLTGDDFVYSPDSDYSLCRTLLQLYEQNHAAGVITCDTKPDNELSRYGVAQVKKKEGINYLEKLIEKPALGKAPSNLVNISKYILPAEIIDIIEHQELNPESGELYITDSIQQLAQESPVVVHQISHQFLDGGNLPHWLQANLTIAAQDPELKSLITETVAGWNNSAKS